MQGIRIVNTPIASGQDGLVPRSVGEMRVATGRAWKRSLQIPHRREGADHMTLGPVAMPSLIEEATLDDL